MPEPTRRFPRRALSPEQVEAAVGVERNVPRSVTQNDVAVLTKRHLGPLWGRRRRKMEGWPK